jgi:heat shock protein 4
MNSDEAVSRGGALQCAILSSRLKVRPFNIIDRVSYNLVATFEGDDSSGIKSLLMYSSGDTIPSKPRRLTFKNKSCNFTIKILYDETYSNVDGNKLVAQFHIKIPSSIVVKGGKTVRVTFNIDKNNCIYCQSAQLMEEIVEKKVESQPIVSKVCDNKISADDDKKSSCNDMDESTNKDLDTNGNKDKDDVEDNKIEKEENNEVIIAKKYKPIILTIETESFGLTRKEIISACDLEQTMAREDRIIVETANIRNDLESYIYSMKDKIHSTYKTYCTDLEKKNLTDKLNAAEEWLYNDGFASTKESYSNKIEGLLSFCEFLDVRMKEFNNRPGAIENFKKQINNIYSFATNNDEAHEHILEFDRDFLRSEAKKSETWLNEQLEKQGKLLQNVSPILTCDNISKKRNSLFNLVNPIITRPKPKPVPVVVPPVVEEPSPSPDKECSNRKDDNVVNKDDNEIEDNKDNSSPMEAGDL